MDHPYYLCEIPATVGEALSQNPEMPHWAPTNEKKTYQSKKALGIIYDYVEEKIQRVLAMPDTQASQPNKHIVALVEKEQQANASRVCNMRKRMVTALAAYDVEMTKLRQRLEKIDVRREEDRKKILYDWKAAYYCTQKRELITCEKGEDAKNLAAAVLYDETLKSSRAKSFNGEVKVRYQGPWSLGSANTGLTVDFSLSMQVQRVCLVRRTRLSCSYHWQRRGWRSGSHISNREREGCPRTTVDKTKYTSIEKV